jgi:hypothetical protein
MFNLSGETRDTGETDAAHTVEIWQVGVGADFGGAWERSQIKRVAASPCLSPL